MTQFYLQQVETATGSRNLKKRGGNQHNDFIPKKQFNKIPFDYFML